MNLLGIDIGSSSVKAALFRDETVVGVPRSQAFDTRYDGACVDVDADQVLGAVRGAIRKLGKQAKSVDAIGLSVMSPSWVAMDKSGKALTPVVTHQDRRSVDIAREIEKRVGRQRHLRITGNRPFPGGISSTTCAWFLRHEPARMKRADLVGHLSTFLHRRMTGERVIDPSNASFTGLYETTKLGGWSVELCDAIGVSRDWLPNILDADAIGGRITKDAARAFGLTAGTPMMAGIVDGSAPMLLAGADVGQLVNASGSTDVLALCTDRPRPHPNLLTRALGVGRRWLHVATLAATGSALTWVREQLFPDLSEGAFWTLVDEQSKRSKHVSVCFDPYLAGERTNVEQRRGAFSNLTLSTTREDMLAAVIESLARSSAARIPLLESRGVKLKHKVVVTGGVSEGLDHILYRDWPGRWTFQPEDEATVRGLARLRPRLS